MSNGVRSIMAAAETYGADNLPVSFDDIRAGLRARDARSITYLLTPADSSPKLSHNGGHAHIVSGVQYLRARRDGGRGNLCPAADSGCVGCYGYGGRAGYDPGINVARQKKVDFMADAPAAYMACLVAETLGIMADAAALEHGVAAVRLNGLSDVAWERVPCGAAACIMDAFPAVEWWDYTRVPGRIAASSRAGWPANYDLTFSLGADNDMLAARAIAAGMKLAVVFRTNTPAGFPETWNGLPVIDGQAHDFRFLEDGPAIVALTAKGPARKDASGWVRETDSAGLDCTRRPAFIRR